MSDLNIPAPTSSAAGANGYSLGLYWNPSQSVNIDRIRYYRVGSSPFPSRVYIQRATNTPIVDVQGDTLTWTSIGGNWFEAVLAANSANVTNALWHITYYLEGASAQSAYYSGTPSPDSPATLTGCYYANSNTSNPTTPLGSGNWYGIDVVWGVGEPGSQEPGPDPAADTFGEHAIWLQYGNPDLRADSLAKLAHDVLTNATYGLSAAKTLLDAIKAKTDLLPFPLNLLTDVWLQARQDDLADLLAYAATADAHYQNYVGSGGGGSGFSVFQDLYERVDVIPTSSRLVGYDDFPGTGWAMTDSTTFDVSAAYAEPAHLYVVSFADLGSNLVNHQAAGADVSYRLAWWTPLTGTLAQQRRFIDTPTAILWDQGFRMPGLLLHSPAGGTGTIQAWTRS